MAGTPRRVYGQASLPGKATAVIGMRWAGKTTFLHQLRAERLAEGVPQERLPYLRSFTPVSRPRGSFSDATRCTPWCATSRTAS